MREYVAEFIGTFGLIFFGTGAIIINDLSGGAITHMGISLAFGLVVMCMIYAFGHISGAHINPAVTIGFWASGTFESKKILPYLLAQFLGAIAASLLLSLLFAEHQTLGMTLPAGSVLQSFILEIILSFFLMLVIIMVVSNEEAKKFAAIAIGGIVLLDALVGGPISGASMNPARSLGPALIAGNLQHLWIYLTAPVIGALLSIFAWKLLKK